MSWKSQTCWGVGRFVSWISISDADTVPVPGFRVDYPDCSGVELAWDGRIVQCVGDAAAIDVLELRRAVPEELL